MSNDQEAYDSWLQKQEAKGREIKREGIIYPEFPNRACLVFPKNQVCHCNPNCKPELRDIDD